LEKKIRIQKRAATLQAIADLLNYRPKMLHISCHGRYHKTTNEFYLAFEDEEKIGLENEITSEKLKECFITNINDKDSRLQLVFVSACHS